MPWTKEDLEEIYPTPVGYALVHSRGSMGNACWFGPFADLDEVGAWLEEHPDVRPTVHALYKDVDWRR